MQQTDGWQGGSQGKFQDYAAQSGAAKASATGRLRWLEKTINRQLSSGTQQQAYSGHAAQGATATQSLAGLIHDARNMVSAMDLYCDLLEEPGVLSAPFCHYAGELRLVSGAGRRLLEELAVAETLTERQGTAHTKNLYLRPSSRAEEAACEERQNDWLAAPRDAMEQPPVGLRRNGRRKVFQCSETVANLAEELRANHSLLSALVGKGITVGLSISGGRRPIAMTGDDLTRVLVNLARNAAEAMSCGGHLQIGLEEGAEYLVLSFTDNGPGIPEAALEAIFSPGYTTRVQLSARDLEPDSVSGPAAPAWPVQHRGLGLSIVRSLVAAAGGSAWAVNRQAVPVAAQQQGKPPDAGGDIALQDSTALQGAVVMIEFPLLEPAIAT